MRNTCLYDIAGTITFRLASRGITLNFKEKEKAGTNLQNIEKMARKMYVPDLGRVLLQTDQSGAEALIVAYLCENGNFRSLFLNGVKPHVFVALHLFSDIWQRRINETAGDIKLDIKELINAAIPDLRKHPFWKEVDKLIKSSDNWPPAQRYYYIAKQVCHSHNYDIRPTTFQLNVLEKSRGKIVLTKRQAEEYGSFYYSLFPEIKEWHREVRHQVETTRILYNLFGFPREFTGEINDKFFKEAYAFIPQSTVGTITNIAVTRLQRFIEENDLNWDILTSTHDSYLVQCPIGEEVECGKVMKSFMEQDLKSPRGEPFKMRSETGAGFNWAPYDPKKNPEGIKEMAI